MTDAERLKAIEKLLRDECGFLGNFTIEEAIKIMDSNIMVLTQANGTLMHTLETIIDQLEKMSKVISMI